MKIDISKVIGKDYCWVLIYRGGHHVIWCDRDEKHYIQYENGDIKYYDKCWCK